MEEKIQFRCGRRDCFPFTSFFYFEEEKVGGKWERFSHPQQLFANLGRLGLFVGNGFLTFFMS